MAKAPNSEKKPAPPRKRAAAKKSSTTKKAAKKPPAKKVATLKLDDPSELAPIVYRRRTGNDDETRQKSLGKMAMNVQKSIEILSERSEKRPVKLLTPAMLRKSLMPYDELSFQYMLGSIGFRTPMAIELIAQEKVGSTTLIMDWMSRLLDMGCYVIYCECEAKQMDDKRIKRLMDRNPKLATLKLNSIEWAEARTLEQFDETLRKSVEDLRKRCDADPATKGNPIFFIGDPWGGLMAKGEAKGNSTWGLAKTAKKEVAKDSSDGSNFEHAKHAQRMARWLPAFMEAHNCTVIFVNKQNDKVDMVAKPRPGMVAPSPSKNDTRVGGRALKRLCAYRMTMLKKDDIRSQTGDKRVYGHNVKIMLVANSYGPRDRTCEATIYFDLHDDTPDYQAPGFTFDDRQAAWIAEQKFLGTTVNKGLYTCDLIGCTAVPAAEFMEAFRRHPDHIDYIGSQLGIEGYSTPVLQRDPVAQDADDEDEEDLDEDDGDLVPDDDEDGEEVPDA